MNRSRTQKLFPFILFAGAALTPLHAQAQTLIYDNGTFSTGGSAQGYQITSFALADDFVFTSTTSFNQARVWLVGLSNFSGTLSWLVRANNGGIPGSTLFSGTVSGASITLTSTGFGTVTQVDFPISSTTLGAGTYWFQVKENGLTDLSDGSEVGWFDSVSSTGFDSKGDPDEVNPSTWTGSVPANRAFQFLSSSVGASAPEPGTLAFIALGGVLVLIQRRGQRK